MLKNPPLVHMETPGQYRDLAETCDRLATQVESEAHRASLIEMANVWRKLAEDREQGVLIVAPFFDVSCLFRQAESGFCHLH
jgi:hypothetical protein